MGKTLLNKFGNTIKRSALAGLIALSFAGCEPLVNPKPNNTNYAPSIISTPVSQVNERTFYNYSVIANDSEGDKLTYSLTKAPNGLSIDPSGKIIGTLPPIGEDTDYNIEVAVSDGTNTTKQNFTLTEKNLCDITGVLQNNETDANQAGTIKLYDGTTELLDTPIDGNFSFHATAPVSQIKLQAQDNNDGYVRTIILDGTRDYSNLIVRAVPKPNFGTITKEEFREFMMYINFDDPSLSDHGLKKSIAKNVQVIRKNPITNNPLDFFDTPKWNELYTKLTSPDDVRRFICGESFNQIIDDSAGQHYTFNTGVIVPEEGWIIIVPNNDTRDSFGDPAGGTHSSTYSNGVAVSTLIEIRPEHAGDNVSTHEWGHAKIAQNGEGNTLNGNYTIMNQDLLIPAPGVADIKAGQIIYEETYLPREKLDDILGTEW